MDLKSNGDQEIQAKQGLMSGKESCPPGFESGQYVCIFRKYAQPEHELFNKQVKSQPEHGQFLERIT